MKTGISLLLFVFVFVVNGYCQKPTLAAVSSAGDEFKNSDISITWTLGEPIIETLTNNTTTITQGFNQTKVIATAIFTLPDSPLEVSVFPNPTSDVLKIKVDAEISKNLNYKILNLTGSCLITNTITSNLIEIDLKNFSNDVYFLEIFDNQKLIKTFKIVKQ